MKKLSPLSCHRVLVHHYPLVMEIITRDFFVANDKPKYIECQTFASEAFGELYVRKLEHNEEVLRSWLCNDRWTCWANIFYFKHEEDLLMFKLHNQ